MLSSSNNDPAPLAGEVASKLSGEEVTLYVVQDEPESEQQLAAFGPYISDLQVVNCTEQVSVCEAENISDVPVFVFPNMGIELVGVQTMDDLKKLLSELNIW